MTDLNPGMVISVTTTVTTAPVAGLGPPESVDFIPYTGPGTWKMYGFTGEKPPPKGVFIDCQLCNECAVDPAKAETVRVKIKTNLRIATAGRFILSPDSRGYGCQGCQRKAE